MQLVTLRMIFPIILATVVIFLAGCEDRVGLAPVVDSRLAVSNNNQGVHRVRPGETLYAIAFRYDKDYRQLAAFNKLQKPYTLRVGQTLRLQYSHYSQKQFNKPSPFYYHATANNNFKSLGSASKHINVMASASQVKHIENWAWPLQGQVVTNFMPSYGKKGIDIASKKGEAVYAAAPGVVAYAGSGLRGYGNLIIIKHNSQLLTAYGNNSHNLVHEGQHINVGERIAEVGVIDRRFWGVHFEIRQAGKPVNPLHYLKRSNGMK